jgi:GntR family transcriptional regulator
MLSAMISPPRLSVVRTGRQASYQAERGRVKRANQQEYSRNLARRSFVSTRNCSAVRTTVMKLSYTRAVPAPQRHRGLAANGGPLDRSSFVPLYYQLQEVLKEQIESGTWGTGEALPSEPELARRFGVSRVVVRQALAILEDDRQIVRLKGRGTFVAEPKLDARAGGLSRSLVVPRPAEVAIQTLDVRTAHVEESIRGELQAGPDDEILRITTCLSLRGVPLSISYSFFRRAEAEWLEAAVHPGRNVPAGLVLADHGIELAQARIAVETSQCGQFEADRFGIPHRASVFLAVCTEFRRDGAATRPFEVARVEYRGDLLRFRLEVSDGGPGAMEAMWELTDPAVAGPSAPARA